MSLQCVYAVNFAEPGPLPLLTALAAAPYTDRTIFGQYSPWTRYNPSPGVYYGHTPYGSNPPGALWQDQNHAQVERLWLIAILHTETLAGVPQSKVLPMPLRTVDGEIVFGLDLTGAKWRLELKVNNVHLPQRMQISALAQWYDPEANNGRGGYVNYLVRRKRSIDEVLGYTPAHARDPAGEQRTTSEWIAVEIDFPADDPSTPRREDEQGLIPIDGRPDKVAANVYGRSVDVTDAYRARLADIMLVAHNGTEVPPVQPFERPGGGFGELYCRKCELWVESSLNPNAQWLTV